MNDTPDTTIEPIDRHTGPERGETSGQRSTALTDVRDADLEPHEGLRYIARLFKILAVLLIVMLLFEIFIGLAQQGLEAIPTLIVEMTRLIVFAGLPLGCGRPGADADRVQPRPARDPNPDGPAEREGAADGGPGGRRARAPRRQPGDAEETSQRGWRATRRGAARRGDARGIGRQRGDAIPSKAKRIDRDSGECHLPHPLRGGAPRAGALYSPRAKLGGAERPYRIS
jgi:hypothetical protein